MIILQCLYTIWNPRVLWSYFSIGFYIMCGCIYMSVECKSFVFEYANHSIEYNNLSRGRTFDCGTPFWFCLVDCRFLESRRLPVSGTSFPFGRDTFPVWERLVWMKSLHWIKYESQNKQRWKNGRISSLEKLRLGKSCYFRRLFYFRCDFKLKFDFVLKNLFIWISKVNR